MLPSPQATPDQAIEQNAVLAILAVIILLSIVTVWGEACVLVIGKRLLQTSAGRSRTSFKAVRTKGAGFIIPLIITNLLRTGMTILWSLLFLIPGIVYAIRTSFYPVIIVCEGIEYRPALARSKECFEGRFFSVTFALLILALTLFLPVQVLDIVLSLVFPQPSAAVFLDVVSSAAQSIAIVLFTTAMILLYGKLKTDKRK